MTDRMVLFISDTHLGEGPKSQARAEEADLIRCLQSHQQRVSHLYLLGDLFEHFIEYDHLVPKGFVRLQGLLARWTDLGIPVTFLAGNHDPWNRTYLQEELGVAFEPDSVIAQHFGQTVYLRHGDGMSSLAQPYRRLKPILRHPVPTTLYRWLLPGDFGMALAKFVSARFGGKDPSPVAAGELRAIAQCILEETPIDIVAMGHTHIADLQHWKSGVYVNSGCWRDDRTFGRLDAHGLHLVRWNGWATEEVDAVAL